MNCYRIKVFTTNALHDTYIHKASGQYIEVMGSEFYAQAESIEEIGSAFPDALELKNMGIAVPLPIPDKKKD